MSEKYRTNYTIMQFAKAPLPGEVKTRMRPKLSELESVELHSTLTRHSWGIIQRAQLCKHELWVGSQPDHSFFTDLLADSDCEIRQQSGVDLGARLADAFKQSLGSACESDRQGAIVVGSDCPFLNAGYFSQALDALDQGADIVLGPAVDGGYVLLGMRAYWPTVFQDIPWGGPQVFKETQKRIKALGLRCVELSTLADIDEPTDLGLLSDSDLPQNLRRYSELK